MIANWIQLWRRNLLRFKLYSFINIAGLSLGISAAAAIYIYILDELSYDQVSRERRSDLPREHSYAL